MLLGLSKPNGAVVCEHAVDLLGIDIGVFECFAVIHVDCEPLRLRIPVSKQLSKQLASPKREFVPHLVAECARVSIANDQQQHISLPNRKCDKHWRACNRDGGRDVFAVQQRQHVAVGCYKRMRNAHSVLNCEQRGHDSLGDAIHVRVYDSVAELLKPPLVYWWREPLSQREGEPLAFSVSLFEHTRIELCVKQRVTYNEHHTSDVPLGLKKRVHQPHAVAVSHCLCEPVSHIELVYVSHRKRQRVANPERVTDSKR